MIKAVIFDMDGLMIDSEILHFEAYKNTVLKYGAVFDIEDYLPYFGMTDKKVSNDLVKKFKLPVSQKELLLQKNKIFRDSFINKIVPKEGLFDLLKNLHKDNYILAVASSSQNDEIKIILSSLKIEHFFKEIISGDFVENSKPAPDIFLLTAKKLNINPINCLVLEDSLQGVIAAKKAGMKCFAIPSPEVINRDFNKADKILKNLGEVYFSLKNT